MLRLSAFFYGVDSVLAKQPNPSRMSMTNKYTATIRRAVNARYAACALSLVLASCGGGDTAFMPDLPLSPALSVSSAGVQAQRASATQPTAAAAAAISPPRPLSALPAGYVRCAGEQADTSCSFSGRAALVYGVAGHFFIGDVTGPFDCRTGNAVFGDPAAGTLKSCFVPASVLAPAPGSYTPLSWGAQQPATHYTLADGTRVTRLGGRTRDRHAREQPLVKGEGDPYTNFAAHYFERRTHEITIYENVSPTNPANRILTLVLRPEWWLYGTNFRHSYIGRRDDDPFGPASVALYGDNGGMKLLPAGTLPAGKELKTPIANYDALPSDPNYNYNVSLNVPPRDGEFVLVKQITYSASLKRELRTGDLLEFELGLFLAGPQGDALGRFNYYADVLVYQVGKSGVQPWFRGPCCNAASIPWDSRLIPATALAGGPMMTLAEDTSNNPEMNFLQAGPNVSGLNIQPFVEGRRLFHTSFLTGAHTEAGNPTLFATQAGKAGPKFQQAACISCHFANGKSSPTLAKTLDKLVVLTGDSDSKGNPVIDPRFGGRLAQGLVTEGGKTFDGRQGVLKIGSYQDIPGQYPDKTPYVLQAPRYALTDVAGKALPLPPHLSVRTAPHLAGMGLLEAVPEASLEALAKASIKDPDGAIGRLQIVADPVNPAIKRVGRFGWRATSASLAQQVALALNGDMGVTTSVLPRHLCGRAASGTACRAADNRGPELSDKDLELMVRYTSLLGVPPQRHFKGEQPLGVHALTILGQSAAQTDAQEQAEANLQARVARGGELFAQARCTACHVPALATGNAHRFTELKAQTIRPYTDMLLHDMGAVLADSYPQGVATQQEWRTAPLWGIGLLSSIDPNVRFLHDGRARSIEEAILWHNGQGIPSRERFKAMTADDRRKLVDFVKSL